MYDIITYIEKCLNNSEEYAIVQSKKQGNSHRNVRSSLVLKKVLVLNVAVNMSLRRMCAISSEERRFL